MVFEPPGTLNRIHRIHRIHRKRNIRCGTDPGFPTPGVRMTVVYTNSLKLSIDIIHGCYAWILSMAIIHVTDLYDAYGTYVDEDVDNHKDDDLREFV